MLKFKHFHGRNCKLLKTDHNLQACSVLVELFLQVLMVGGTIYGFTTESNAVLLYASNSWLKLASPGAQISGVASGANKENWIRDTRWTELQTLSYTTFPAGIAAPCDKLDSHINFCLKKLFCNLKENTSNNKTLPITSQNDLIFIRQNNQR